MHLKKTRFVPQIDTFLRFISYVDFTGERLKNMHKKRINLQLFLHFKSQQNTQCDLSSLLWMRHLEPSLRAANPFLYSRLYPH